MFIYWEKMLSTLIYLVFILTNGFHQQIINLMVH